MEMTDTDEQGFKVVHIRGRVDSASAANFEGNLMGYIESGHKNIILDCTQMDYIASAGLRVVLSAAKKIKAGQGKFALAGLNENVYQVFEISGFLSILSIKPSVSDAIKFFS